MRSLKSPECLRTWTTLQTIYSSFQIVYSSVETIYFTLQACHATLKIVRTRSRRWRRSWTSSGNEQSLPDINDKRRLQAVCTDNFFNRNAKTSGDGVQVISWLYDVIQLGHSLSAYSVFDINLCPVGYH